MVSYRFKENEKNISKNVFEHLTTILSLFIMQTSKVGISEMTFSDNHSDEELQQAAAAGSAEAEEALVRRYTRLVHSVSRPFYLAGAEREDLIQEGLIGLLRAIRNYRPQVRASFQSYAAVCIRNTILNAIRDSAGKRNVSLDDCLSLESSLSTDFPVSSAATDSPEDSVIGREEKELLHRRVVQILTPLEQQVLREYLRGLGYREIAANLGKTEKSVDNAIQRIRRKLSTVREPNGGTSFG